MTHTHTHRSRSPWLTWLTVACCCCCCASHIGNSTIELLARLIDWLIVLLCTTRSTNITQLTQKSPSWQVPKLTSNLIQSNEQSCVDKKVLQNTTTTKKWHNQREERERERGRFLTKYVYLLFKKKIPTHTRRSSSSTTTNKTGHTHTKKGAGHSRTILIKYKKVTWLV